MPFLIATLLTCEDAKGIISKIEPSVSYRTEIVQMIKSNTKECTWDAKAD